MIKIYCAASWRVKWLSFVILLISSESKAFMQDSAGITIHASNTSIEMVFRQIEKQTGYSFYYSKPTLDGSELITINLTRTSLPVAMNTILKGKNVNWQLRNGGVILSKKQTTPDSPVDTIPTINMSGRVVDAQGKPLPGATVNIRGLNKGQSTDNQGYFSFANIPTNTIFTVSFLGYEGKQVKLSGKNEILIALDPTVTEINSVEVVSTGYQKLSPERTTGSFNKIGQELLDRKVSTDILSRLDGVSAGLLFDKRDASNPKLQIRGLYTLSESIAQPLIILDKFPYAGDIRAINPNDVESITILKDAASASIWGAKAGNGVIVITTKQGKFNKPLSISLNANVSYTKMPDLNALNEVGTSDYIDVESFLFGKGYYNSTFNDILTPTSPVVEILRKQQAGLITQDEATRLIDSYRGKSFKNAFMDNLYRNVQRQQYSISLTAGGKDLTSYFSMGYDKSPSYLKGDEYQRVTFKHNAVYRPTKKLQVETGVFFSQGNSLNNSLGDFNSPSFKTMDNKGVNPYADLLDASGVPLSLDLKYSKNFTDTAGQGKLLDWKYYPLKELALNDKKTVSQDLIADLSIKYQLIKGLNAEASYRYQTGTAETDNYRSNETFYTRDLINSFSNINGGSVIYNIPNSGILDEISQKITTHSFRGMLSFDRVFNSVHEVSAIAGGEVRETRNTANSDRTYGYNDQLGFTNMDLVNQYPLFTGGSTTIPTTRSISALRDRFVALYGNVSYTYDNRYILSLSARKDASNLFGVKSNDKGRPFWSVGGSWNLSNESFYHLAAVPYIRLRATYGYSGNVNQSINALTVLLYSPSSVVTGLPGARIITPGNPDLRWEKLSSFNTGLDFNINGNIVSGSIEYYSKKSTDVIGQELKDPSTGIQGISTNSASLKGDGIDLRLNFNIINNSVIRYQLGANFSYVKYTVAEYLGRRDAFGNFSNGNGILPIVGQNPYTIITNRWGGLDPATGNPRGYINGKLSSNYDSLVNIAYAPLANQVFNGSALPKYYGNLLHQFSSGPVSLSFNMTYRLGYFYRRPTIQYESFFRNGLGHSDFTNRWKAPGDEQYTNVPSMIYPNNTKRDLFFNNSEVNVINASHIRLEDIRVSYAFSDRILKKIKLKELQVYGNVSDMNVLLYNAGNKGDDPNFPTGMKTPVSFTGGVRATF